MSVGMSEANNRLFSKEEETCIFSLVLVPTSCWVLPLRLLYSRGDVTLAGHLLRLQTTTHTDKFLRVTVARVWTSRGRQYQADSNLITTYALISIAGFL